MRYLVDLKRASKVLTKVPKAVVARLLASQQVVEVYGLPAASRQPSLHDEPLKGKWAHQKARSIRLSGQWRAIYVKHGSDLVVVEVLNVTAHDCRKK